MTSQASADSNNHGSDPMVIQLDTSHGVGVYGCAGTSCGKVDNGLTLSPHQYIYADCWVSGENVGNDGDVWYRTLEDGSTPDDLFWPGQTYDWTFAPYVDGGLRFHMTPGMPHC